MLILYVTSIIGRHYVSNYFGIWNAFQYMSYFYLGFIIRQHGNFFKKIHGLLWFFIYGALFIGFSLIRHYLGNESIFLKFMNLGGNYLTTLVGAVMSFTLLQWIASKISWQNALMSLISKRSMGIYLFHQQIIWFCLYLLNSYVNPYLLAPICFILSILVSFGIVSLFLLTKLSRLLIGEKI